MSKVATEMSQVKTLGAAAQAAKLMSEDVLPSAHNMNKVISVAQSLNKNASASAAALAGNEND